MTRRFGENLKRIRTAAGVSQEELARRLGLKRQAQISLWENKDILPTPGTIMRVARALKAPAKDFLEEVDTDYDRIRRGEPIRIHRDASASRKAPKVVALHRRGHSR